MDPLLPYSPLPSSSRDEEEGSFLARADSYLARRRKSWRFVRKEILSSSSLRFEGEGSTERVSILASRIGSRMDIPEVDAELPFRTLFQARHRILLRPFLLEKKIVSRRKALQKEEIVLLLRSWKRKHAFAARCRHGTARKSRPTFRFSERRSRDASFEGDLPPSGSTSISNAFICLRIRAHPKGSDLVRRESFAQDGNSSLEDVFRRQVRSRFPIGWERRKGIDRRSLRSIRSKEA